MIVLMDALDWFYLKLWKGPIRPNHLDICTWGGSLYLRSNTGFPHTRCTKIYALGIQILEYIHMYVRENISIQSTSVICSRNEK